MFGKIIQYVISGFWSLVVFAIGGLLATVFYFSIEGVGGIIAAAVAGVITLALGILIFNSLRKSNARTIIANVNVTEDLDNLAHADGSSGKFLTAQGLSARFHSNTPFFETGFLEIFGVTGKFGLEVKQKIKDIQHDAAEDELILEFEEKGKLSVTQPGKIFLGYDSLKILNGQEVVLHFEDREVRFSTDAAIVNVEDSQLGGKKKQEIFYGSPAVWLC